MTRGQALRECARRNAAREVTEHTTWGANADQFWNRCNPDSNFVISGGTEVQRTDMLMSMLRNYRSNCSDPVIILTGSASTEASVLRDAKDNLLRRASISSPAFRNYNALHGMDAGQMKRLLVSVAQRKGYRSTDMIEHYIEAFIAICSRTDRLSLASLLKLDRQYPTNRLLCDYATTLRVDPKHREAIRSYPTGTHNLHSILLDLKDCYSHICNPDAFLSVDLHKACQDGELICLRTNSLHPDILDLALAAELQALTASNRKFLLVLNDVPMLDAEGLYREVIRTKNTGDNITVGICTRNACSWARMVQGVTDATDTLIKNTATFALFNAPNESDCDLGEILHYLGQYLRHDVAMGGGHEAILFPILSRSEWHVGPGQLTDRVRPEDAEGYEVILKGHDGRHIHLHRAITL